ncbi:MAG: membrane protein insertion efficiency factor YidD [Draconibacterium sp.]|nr:membrane protein insertion efficiency factor YidD [Draconibacterium sp.]
MSSRKGPSCIYIPTCSHYSKEVLKEWGFIRGSALAVLRILKCNPLFKPKYDPVSKRKQIKKVISHSSSMEKPSCSIDLRPM